MTLSMQLSFNRMAIDQATKAKRILISLLSFSSPEPKDHKVSLQDGTRAGVRPCVRPCVHTFKHEYLRDQQADYNQILSEASLGWGKGCIRF